MTRCDWLTEAGRAGSRPIRRDLRSFRQNYALKVSAFSKLAYLLWRLTLKPDSSILLIRVRFEAVEGMRFREDSAIFRYRFLTAG